MLALVSYDKIQLPAGAVVRLPATWKEYQTLSQQRGEGTMPRIKYRNGEVLLMSPMPHQGREASLMADIIKVLLDHAGQGYNAFTPVTMDLPKASGIEPDYCFCIDHGAAGSGQRRIDWSTNPLPDLVLEIEVTSYSDVRDYLPYRVPECWLVKGGQLNIHQLQEDRYSLGTQSRYFPDFDLQAIVIRALALAHSHDTSAAIGDLRAQLTGGAEV